MSQTINLKVNRITGEHVYTTLFMNGASCGQLVFRIGEYQIFSTLIMMGVKQTMGHLVDTSDYSVFEEWAKRKDK